MQRIVESRTVLLYSAQSVLNQKIGQFKVPADYEVWRDGVFKMSYGKEIPKHLKGCEDLTCPADHTKNMPEARRLLINHVVAVGGVWVDCIGRDLKSDEFFISLKSNEVSRETWISRESLVREAWLARLAGLGFPIDKGCLLAFARYLNLMIQRNVEKRLSHVGTRSSMYELPDGKIGWLLRDRWIGPKGTRVYWTGERTSNLQDGLISKGTLESWIGFCKTYTEDNPFVRWLVFSGFAAPLLKLCNVRSFIVHHWYESGAGKSAIAKLGQSIWGHPEKFLTTFNATQLSMVEQFQHVSNLCVAFDELQASDFKNELRNTIYRIMLEQPRQRLNRGGSLQARGQDYSVLVKFTAEQPLLDNPNLDLGGIRNRTIELKVDPGLKDSSEIHRWLASKAAAYGVAGPEFLKKILVNVNRDLNELRMQYFSLRKRFDEINGKHEPKMDQLAIIALGQAMARVALYGESYDKARDIAISDGKLILAQEKESDKPQAFKDRIIPAIEAGLGSVRAVDLSTTLGKQTLIDRGLMDFQAIVNPGARFPLYKDEWLWVRGHRALKSILSDSGLHVMRSLSDLEDLGLTERYAGKWTHIRSLDGKGSLRVYVFRKKPKQNA